MAMAMASEKQKGRGKGKGALRAVRRWVFERHRFCCCLPVRVGVIVMSLANLLVSGLLSVICWWEVAANRTLDAGERGAFVGAGLVETLLALLSILGFVGAVVRKQSFVTAYCYALYAHFLVNLAVASYFLYVILHAEHAAATRACEDAIEDAGAQGQCLGLLRFAAGIYGGLAGGLLALELYGAFMATRYVHQVKHEKRKMKARAEGLPLHVRGASDGGDGDGVGLMGGYVRYTDENGESWYDRVGAPLKDEVGEEDARAHRGGLADGYYGEGGGGGEWTPRREDVSGAEEYASAYRDRDGVVAEDAPEHEHARAQDGLGDNPSVVPAKTRSRSREGASSDEEEGPAEPLLPAPSSEAHPPAYGRDGSGPR
ncbi:hypothetical protein HETIRDRAFT_101844 [Heterobasidion irregulare TC 32-1]|uniref:Uncharacterized protein n=1 Tax=Heterobasidion irregulare (strain TC 32-1) TaxID=747525 RepID=W4K4P1_HETIT|nr:uncharacterized protein HETIRDRAFT_101844 [Heterobasidion irregulare TC 32-1]ETW80729.1 hypothetical protein HETIRDRAFT_101844 [Heterobasidion irregulare TC 32-1]